MDGGEHLTKRSQDELRGVESGLGGLYECTICKELGSKEEGKRGGRVRKSKEIEGKDHRSK